MISASTADRDPAFMHIEAITLQPPYEAIMLNVSLYPMPEQERAAARQFLHSLTVAASSHSQLAVEVFIHMAHLRDQDGSGSRFSSKGRSWLPRLGLGVWPDRPAPTIWTREDFDKLAPGKRPRTLRNHVFRISGSLETREEARSSMLGWGSVIEILAPNAEAFLEKTRELLLPTITDPSFSCFPFYVPLLEKKSLISSPPEKMDSWFCGASLYIRESREDNGILIASALNLAPILKGLGAEPENDRQTKWRVPVVLR